MKFRNVIFDLDGTLIDSAQLTGAIIDQMLSERGALEAADRELIRKMDAVGGAAMIEAVMGRHTQDPAADLEDFRSRHRNIAVPRALPFPGVVDALEELRARDVSLAICSNKPQVLCDMILSSLGISGHFLAIVGSAPHRPRKPDPASALVALSAIGGLANETIYCGDSMIDVSTARNAGLSFCLVAWGYGTHDAVRTESELPILSKMTDLIELVHGRISLDQLARFGDLG